MDDMRRNSVEIALLFILAACVLAVLVEVVTAYAADAG
jgi:hypothetical protein